MANFNFTNPNMTYDIVEYGDDQFGIAQNSSRPQGANPISYDSQGLPVYPAATDDRPPIITTTYYSRDNPENAAMNGGTNTYWANAGDTFSERVTWDTIEEVESFLRGLFPTVVASVRVPENSRDSVTIERREAS